MISFSHRKQCVISFMVNKINFMPKHPMKKLFFCLLTFALGLTVSFAQTSPTPVAEEAAIKQVIEAEKAAYDAADYKTYLSHWARVPYASCLIFGEQYVGDALWKQMDKIWANKKPVKNNNNRSNWNIHIRSDAAFVTFSLQVENTETKSVWETAQARYMEKRDGQWKIVNMTVVEKPAK